MPVWLYHDSSKVNNYVLVGFQEQIFQVTNLGVLTDGQRG